LKKPTLWVNPADIETLRIEAPSMNISELFDLFEGRYTKLQIRKKLFMNNIEYTRSDPDIYHYRKYSCDTAFFDSIDTPEKAYVLGYWAADGLMRNNDKSYEVSITSNDKDHLYLVNTILSSNRPLVLEGKESRCWKLCITNKKLYNALLRLGFTNRKSLTLQYPTFLDTELDSHFIRGFFDGDGCITMGFRNSIYICLSSGSYNFLDNVNNRLPIKVNQIKLDREGSNTLGMRFTGDTARYFLSYIYRDSEGLRLERKYNRYQDYLNRRGIFAPPVMTERIKKNMERRLEEARLRELKCA